MSIIYIKEEGSKVQFSGGRLTVLSGNNSNSFPIESIDAMVVIGQIALSNACSIQMLERGIPVTYISSRGKYYGRLQSTKHTNIHRQRLQFKQGEDENFCMGLAKSFVEAKVNNQLVLLRRYNRNVQIDEVAESIEKMEQLRHIIKRANSTSQLMGYEGTASRVYFGALSQLVEKEFAFKGRTRMPPKDEFNSLLSYGYTLLLYEIFTVIESRGINPYAGFMHKDKHGHPALASDLIEEWRPVIVDSLVLNLIQGHRINKSDFTKDDETGGVFLKKEGNKKYVMAFEDKLKVEVKYFEDMNCSFRRGIEHQVLCLIKAIESGEPNHYMPIRVR
ncbi:CRISPR-associated endonuclease Cas1 [Bacillota bacterium]